MSEIILLFGIGCSILSVVSGLTLSSNSRFIQSDAFILVCDVQGTITTSIQFNDALGSLVGFCSPPPLSCNAPLGNTLQRDINKGTVSLSIPKQNIQIPASEGNWSCTDGITADFFSVKIYSYTEPVFQSEVEVPVDGSVITVLIECIYPYPDEVKISYVKKSHPYPVLKSRNDVKFENGTSTNCPVPDTRAISMNGTFLLSTDNLNEEARIAVSALLNGFELSNPGYSNFTIQSGKKNEPSDVGHTTIIVIIVGVVGVVGIIVAVVFINRKKIKKEVKSKIDPQSRKDLKVKELIKELLDWINKVLADCKITVKDIEKDLSDGEILQMLIENLAGEKVRVPQSERDQKQKLQIIITFINRILQESSPRAQIKWSVDSVSTMNLVAILHLLVALARHYRAPIRLPENVSVNLVVETKQCGTLDTRIVAEVINPVNEYAETTIG